MDIKPDIGARYDEKTGMLFLPVFRDELPAPTEQWRASMVILETGWCDEIYTCLRTGGIGKYVWFRIGT